MGKKPKRGVCFLRIWRKTKGREFKCLHLQSSYAWWTRECIWVENALWPRAICNPQQLFRDHCWWVGIRPFCLQSHKPVVRCTSRLYIWGSSLKTSWKSFAQWAVLFSVLCTYFRTRQYSVPVMLKASPFTLNLLSETTRSVVVELSGTSLAESWFRPVGFGFFPLQLASTWCGMIRIRKEIILNGFLLEKSSQQICISGGVSF